MFLSVRGYLILYSHTTEGVPLGGNRTGGTTNNLVLEQPQYSPYDRQHIDKEGGKKYGGNVENRREL